MTKPLLLTTGQAARMIGVSTTCISRAVDAGLLQGFRLPGSKHRRLFLADFLQWCKDNDIPLPESDSQTDA